jgi:peptidyl-prolyl cis-trans isomerase-like 4
MALLLETVWGDLVIDLDDGASDELRYNFLKLARARFFTNTLVYAVTPNRFCQLGDPVGDGTGGTSIHGLLDDTTTTTHHYRTSSRRFLASSCGRSVMTTVTAAAAAEQPLPQRKGLVVATCSSRLPDTIGSQFLITTAGGPDHGLDGYLQKGDENLFVVLGQVVEDDGNVLDKINNAFLDPEGRPYADIRIIRALPVYDPYDDPPGLAQYLAAHNIAVVSFHAAPMGENDNDNDGITTTNATTTTNRIMMIRSPSPENDRPDEEVVAKRISAADVDAEDLDNDETLQRRLQEEQEATEQRYDKSRAVVLEMLGDLPDAEITAPENVLFLCKLNPVTVDEDLELILARFDEKVTVEIIRDADTGASLQYAFAEFTNKRAAEEAYFKMNNALIDDRRIKVDFSQSVAKLWDKYHQRMRRTIIIPPKKPHQYRADGGSFAAPQPQQQQQQRLPLPPPQQQKRSTARQEPNHQYRHHHSKIDNGTTAARPRDNRPQDGHRQQRPRESDDRHGRGRNNTDRLDDDDDYRGGRDDNHDNDRRRRREDGRRRDDHIGTPTNTREDNRATPNGTPSRKGENDHRTTTQQREKDELSNSHRPRDNDQRHFARGDRQEASATSREHGRSTTGRDHDHDHDRRPGRREDHSEERGERKRRRRRHDDDSSDESSMASSSSRSSSEQEESRHRHRKKKDKKKSSDHKHHHKKSSKKERKHRKKHRSRTRSASRSR